MKRHRVLIVVALVACGALLSVDAEQGPPRGPRPARTRKVVLAWADTRNGIAQHDFTSHALSVIERLGYETGLYDTFIRTDSNIIAKEPKRTTGESASGGPSLAMADAIFFLGHRDVPIDEAQKKELLAYVRDEGKGFVAAHTGLTAFESWPEFGELLGARYDGHPWHQAGHGDQRGRRFPGDQAFSCDVRDQRRVLPAEGVLAERAGAAATRCVEDAAARRASQQGVSACLGDELWQGPRVLFLVRA